MEINELYNLAKQYADMIMQNKPEYISENESAVCVIVDGDEQPTTGITTITVKGGQVETIPAETVAYFSRRRYTAQGYRSCTR